jgi:condensin complex subunit 3
MTTYDQVTQMQDDLEDDQVMIEPYQFGLQFIDWTNPQKASDP